MMISNIKKIGYVVAIAFVAVFLSEHIGRLNDVNVRPSVVLNYISDKFEEFFRFLGFLSAKISSFLSWLDFEEMYKTLQDLASPISSIFTSPLMIIDGYITTVAEYDNWYMLLIGSLVIISAVVYVAYQYLPKSYYASWISKSVMIYLSICIFLLLLGNYSYCKTNTFITNTTRPVDCRSIDDFTELFFQNKSLLLAIPLLLLITLVNRFL